MCDPLDVSQKSCEFSGVRTTVRRSRFDSPSSAFMKASRVLLLVSCLAFTIASTHATTVIPPTFDQLVNDAETIFEGTVSAMHSEWAGQGSERHIVTYVTFKIEDPIKGALGAETTLRMFGGTI